MTGGHSEPLPTYLICRSPFPSSPRSISVFFRFSLPLPLFLLKLNPSASLIGASLSSLGIYYDFRNFYSQFSFAGDSCCFSFSLGKIQQLLEAEIPGVYIHSIRIGNNEIEDVENSYFGNINEQVKHVCEQLSQDPNLQNGYNAIGFSQGAQFLRAVAQRCPSPPMLNLISLGGQHQGVFGIPKCADTSRLCNYMRRMLHHGAYLWYIQNSLIQASFWHDPLQEDEYRKKNLFLADINNENTNNTEYKNNLQRLQGLVLVKFENDTMVEPVETEWFGFYKPGQTEEVQNLQQSELYQQDLLGLRAMENAGKIYYLSLPGDHLQFSTNWFIENIIKKHLI